MRTSLYLTVVSAIALATGCGAERTRVDIRTYDEAGQEQQHFSAFNHASYRLSPGGLLELVMRAERASTIDPTQTITQIVYLKTFWTPRPGTTYIEETQINARIRYALLTPPTGVRYDGAGFLTYKRDGSTGDLVCHLESATLAPRYRMGEAVEPFGSARLSGTVRATEDPRDVVTTLQMLDAQFREEIPSVQ